jgi:Cu(I)/Ag(I) efflux system membrane fusion protein
MPTKLSINPFLLPFALLVVAAVSACSPSGKMAGKPDDVDYYTCTMHPSVKSQNPDDKCPICGMDLVPVMKKGRDAPAKPAMADQPMAASSASSDQPSEFTIPPDRQQLIGVTYTKVARYPLHSVVRAVGTVAVDMRRHWEYVARVDGYVHELKVFSPGQIVEKGQVLMDIYSPDLTATQNEFIGLLNMRDKARQNGSAATQENAEQLLASAHQRLNQWNLTDAQVDELTASRKAGEFLTLTSPFRGLVEAVPVDQGRRIMIGDHLVDVADLSHVWVWAEFYQEELPLLHAGMAVSISTSSLPGEGFTGQIAVIDPFIDEMKRTVRVRIDLENPDFKLRPEMYVDAELAVDRGESLTVPFSAVLPTGTRNIVFVDKGGGKLEPRFIELAGKFGDFYAVSSGLKEGERVVSSANFLIDAESKVQGALKDF